MDDRNIFSSDEKINIEVFGTTIILNRNKIYRNVLLESSGFPKIDIWRDTDHVSHFTYEEKDYKKFFLDKDIFYIRTI